MAGELSAFIIQYIVGDGIQSDLIIKKYKCEKYQWEICG